MSVIFDPTGNAISPRYILLVEPYDALASAIGSTLKKFAPHCERRWVTSIADAEKAAIQLRPELFVFDLDPPLAGTTGLLGILHAKHPEARLLVLASNLAKDVPESGAIHFLPKAFTVPEFGEKIQALLSSSQSFVRESAALRTLSFRDLIQLECATGATAILSLATDAGDTGEIHFLNGDFCHATAPGSRGFPALVEILSWPSATCTERERSSDSPRTIRGPWSENWRKALGLTNGSTAARMPRPVAPPAAARTFESAPPAKIAPKILVVDDVEELRTFVAEILAAENPEAQISTAASGYDGFYRAEAIQPDLLLLDHDLPDINGSEICRRLLENEQTARIPVIMMSGDVAAIRQLLENRSNVVAAIAKPFRPDALVEIVKGVLSKGLAFKSPATATVLPPEISNAPANPEPPAISETENSFGHAGNGHGPSSYLETSWESAAPTMTELRTTPTHVNEPRSRGDVILTMTLEVLSVEVTGFIHTGTIRARLAAPIVSLHHLPGATGGLSPLEKDFELNRVQLNEQSKIELIRLVPTRRPHQIEAASRFELGAVAIESADLNLQMESGGEAPRRFHLLGKYEIALVELSTSFEVAFLILKSRGEEMRATFHGELESREANHFRLTSVALDHDSQISEFLLAPSHG